MAPRTRPGPPPANPRGAIQDWLNLVEPDGAFLTPSELLVAFPSGFDPMDAAHRTELRARVADLEDDPAGRQDLRRWLLATVLDWDDQLAEGQRIPGAATARIAEHGIHLRPDAVLLGVDDPNKVRLGVFTWPTGTRLDRRPDPSAAGDTWPATPVQRAEAWCREAGVPLALVTDDDQWVLVWAPRQAPAASGRWRTSDLADERILQAGFVSLLGARRFFAVAEDQTLERLFERAADAEAEITKGLGLSVRRSVELLIAAISRDDVASGGKVLAGVPGTEVYEAAVSVLMRLVFLLFAEERRLLPAEDPLWAESYSVLTLRDDLRTAATRDGEDALERRATAWHRLLATFRAVHGGANHDRLSLPAYGGSLFDPDRFPFLEGRRAPDHVVAGGVDLGPADVAPVGPGRPVAIDDRTVLAILDALLNVQVKVGRSTVAQRVSYKALDVEQIGHCYEGLLDHGATPVDQLALGLVGPEGAEPELTVSELEDHLAPGPDALCEWLADKTRCAKTATALAKLLDKEPDGIDLARLRVACGHDDDTLERVLSFWGLIRTDLRALPIVLLPGSLYVTQTSTRRNMGAQYTTKALAEEVVRYALEPLVYDPGPQNEADPEKWRLRTPHEILDLRVCDPAVGSGAILTAAGRYLADRLIESVTEHGPGEGRFAGRLADLAAAPADEQVVLARREVVDHCLYGVDKNPVAAEMAKLSLWLTTMARERPFTFLDHAIQVGDSLLGITDLDQLRWLHLDPDQRKGQRGFDTLTIDLRVKEAAELARRLQERSVVTVRDATEKQRLHHELLARLADLAVVADAIVGAALSTAGQRGTTMAQRLDTQLDRIRVALDDGRPEVERHAAIEVLRGVSTGWLRTHLPDDPPMPWDRRCLHWPLAFPEVFLGESRSGFDSMIGNPPFRGGSMFGADLGTAYRGHVVRWIGYGVVGRADLCGYFFNRSERLLGPTGATGMIATQSISEAHTRRASLEPLLEREHLLIHRANTEVPWPSNPGLLIALIWMKREPWTGLRYLNGSTVLGISPELQSGGGEVPMKLDSSPKSFRGVEPRGKGFILDENERSELLRREPASADIVVPFYGGKDLNLTPPGKARRWIIDFRRTPDSEKAYPLALAHVEATVRPHRERISGQIHEHRWWIFWDKREANFRSVADQDYLICKATDSDTWAWAVLRDHGDVVVGSKVLVVVGSDVGLLASLQSELHYLWAVRYGSSIGSGMAYRPSEVLDTYPLPTTTRAGLIEAAREYIAVREDVMTSRGLGLTPLYSMVNNSDERSPDLTLFRASQVQLDHAVRDAYGWSDLALDHHHWETPQGMRFTVSPTAKDEILDRLLELNHERYAAEVAAGLHDKKTKGGRDKGSAKSAGTGQGSLLD